MKITALIARILLGLIFVFFGLNGIFHFLPTPPPPQNTAGQFITAFMNSGYAAVVSVFQVIGGALLLSGFFVPLALAILGPIIVNILIFHILMSPQTILPGLVVTVLWFILAYRIRSAFAGLFLQKT